MAGAFAGASVNLQQAYARDKSIAAPVDKEHMRKTKVSRLGVAGVPYEELNYYIELGYDFIASVRGQEKAGITREQVHSLLTERGIEHFDYASKKATIRGMGTDNVPPERRGLKRGLGNNKYNNEDCVCGGWDEGYRFIARCAAERMKGLPDDGLILEDFQNRALCYCKTCEAQYRADTGKPGFPSASYAVRVYETPHYEDNVAFDPALIEWDRKRFARHVKMVAEPLHKSGKKVAIAGPCRWLVGPRAAEHVDHTMFYTYYAGRRLPPNYLRNWKYWHDHLIPENLWVVVGYFREYHTCHTRLMVANLPDGVGLLFWPGYRQVRDPQSKEDAIYAYDIVTSSLVPIRIAVYDSTATEKYYQREVKGSWRQGHVDKPIIGLERLGFDATAVRSLENLDDFELLYLEDVECLSDAEVDRIKRCDIPILATGLSGLRDEKGELWKKTGSGPTGRAAAYTTLNLPGPVSLSKRSLNIDTEALRLDYPWFEFMFDTISTKRADPSMCLPYTDPSHYHGVRKYNLHLNPSRIYGEFLANSVIGQYEGVPIALSSETRQPMIIYNAAKHFVYSSIKFSDYVNVHDLTECGYGYQMRQFCFLQIIDALTMQRRGVNVEPYLMTAIRRTDTGHFLAIGNVYDEPRTVRVTLARGPKAVRVNHKAYDKWDERIISLPPIEAKGAIQIHIDY